MNPVIFLVLVALLFIVAGLRKKKRRRKRRGLWSFFKSKTKKRKHSWYQGQAWTRVRDKRREANNKRYGLGKSRIGALLLKCDRCGAVGTGHQVDHIKARSTHPHLALSYANTQVLCSTKSRPKALGCNQKKSNKKGHNWRRIRTMPGGAVLAWWLRVQQVRKGER